MKPIISIVICTKDRADSLAQTLASIKRATIPVDLPVELVVVDNGSTDHTEQVVQSAALAPIIGKYFREPKIGKSHAYNAALSVTTGEILLCTDDDVRVPAGWIEGMCRPIFRGEADAVAGGVVFPYHIESLFKTPPLKNRRGWFASTHEIPAQQPGRMVGANMAFHRRVLKKVPVFDVELGPGPNGLGNFEDTLFSWQLLAAGFKLAGALDIAVEHHFDLARTNSRAMMDSARKMGRSHGFIFHHWEHKKSYLALPRFIWKHARRYWLQGNDRWAAGDGNATSAELLKLEEELAFYDEYLIQKRRRFKYPARSQDSLASPGKS